MVSCALAFLFGILLVQQQAELPSPWWALTLAPAVALVWWRNKSLPVVFFIAGVLWVSWRAGLVLAERLPEALEGRDLAVEGSIADIPRPGERGLRFEFALERATLDGVPVELPRRVLLSAYDAPMDPAVGERWAFTVRLKRPHGLQNPGGFDYEAWLFQHRIGALGTVRTRDPPRRLAGGDTDPFGRFRHSLSRRIAQLLPEHPYAGLVTAFANGDENSVGNDQWRVLQRTGTTHLVAISGMNIGLVAGLVFLLARRAWALPGSTVLRLPAPKAAALVAFAAAAFYSALAGFAIPTQRALVMLAVALGALLLDRRVAPTEVLATALLAVLVLDPLAVLAFGFWLSFAAVAIILYVLPESESGRGLRARLHAFARMQWAVAIGMLPLTLALFQSAALAGPFANALAIPVVELVVIPATLLGVLVSVLPDAVAQMPFRIASLALAALWPVLEWLAAFDHSQWMQPTPPVWTLVAAGIGVAWLLAPRGFPGRWVGGAWLLPMLLVRPPAPAAGEIWFTLLDVGQGLAAVVRTASHTLVYDTGPRRGARFDTGRAVVTPFLRQAGVERVDALVVSHGDNDHIGGAASLLESFPVARLLSSVPQRLSGAAPCRAGERWEWDGVRLEVLHPAAETTRRDNNASCVLLVSGRHGRVLLPGDLAAAGERELVARAGERLRAEWLVVPHHGARGSSSAAFIAAVRPAQALISAGYRNAHRHPHAAVLARYDWIGARLHNTAGQGALTARLGAGGARFSAWRAEQPRYWRAPALPPDAAL